MMMFSGEDVKGCSHATREGSPMDEREMEEIEEDRDAMLEWSETMDSGDEDDEMDRIGGRIGTLACSRCTELP